MTPNLQPRFEPNELPTLLLGAGTGDGGSFEDLTGRQLGDFAVVALLGDGGMARVYKGYQPSVDRFVALKVLAPRFAHNPAFVARFRQEARIVAGLQHPHILPVFYHGESGGYPFLAMPFIESGTLADTLARGPLPLADVARVIAQICDALDYAHALGIVHRDIKPGNILIDSEGNAFLADFGIATSAGSDQHLTPPGMVVASPSYCAPEQLIGGAIGSHTDLYSVGMVLYELLTGTQPFHIDGSLASILKRADITLQAPRARNSRVTPELEAVIVKAVAASPGDRYATGRELAAALSEAVRRADGQHTILSARPADRPSPDSTTVTGLPVSQPVIEPPMPSPAMPSPTRRRSVRARWAATALGLGLGGWLLLAMSPHTAARVPDHTTSATSAASSLPKASEPGARQTTADAAGRPAATVVPLTKPSPIGDARTGAPASTRTNAVIDNGTRTADAVTAKHMFGGAAGGGSRVPGLKYRIIEQRGSNTIDADPSLPFHSGDRVRFAFETNIDGYLYVVSAGSSGRWRVLFPAPDANGGLNAISRAEEYLVPDSGWFAFDDTPGTEEVFVLVSKWPLETLPGFDAPVTRHESVDTSVVLGLQARIQPRDLVFQKDHSLAADGRTRHATYIVNRGELASQVSALIQLTHSTREARTWR